MKPIAFLLIIALSLSGCELIPDLKRDNPDDQKGINYTTHLIEFDHYDISNQINPEPGATIGLKIYIKNIGTGTLSNVKGIITTESQYITELTNDSLYFSFDGVNEQIEPNQIVQGWQSSVDSIGFKISKEAPVGSKISFNLNLKDNKNRSWTVNFSIDVTDFVRTFLLEFDHIENYGAISPEPGADIALKIFIKNSGTGILSNVKGTITTVNQYISNFSSDSLHFSPDGYIEQIEPNEIVQGWQPMFTSYDYSISFHISSQAPIGNIILFDLNLKDDKSRQWKFSFNVEVVQ